MTSAPVQHIGDPIATRDQRNWVLSTELCAEADISFRQLDYWTRTGLLTPLGIRRPGSGHVRAYHQDQVARARVIKALLGVGVTLTHGGIRDVVDEALDTGEVHLGPVTITIHPSGDTAA